MKYVAVNPARSTEALSSTTGSPQSRAFSTFLRRIGRSVCTSGTMPSKSSLCLQVFINCVAAAPTSWLWRRDVCRSVFKAAMSALMPPLRRCLIGRRKFRIFSAGILCLKPCLFKIGSAGGDAALPDTRATLTSKTAGLSACSCPSNFPSI